MLKINDAAAEIHEENVRKGWWLERVEVPGKMEASGIFTQVEVAFVKNLNMSQMLVLTVGELSEAQEALRIDRRANLKTFNVEYAETSDLVAAFETHLKDTFEDELADAIIRILDLAHSEGVDMETHIMLKRLYNRTRPFKHGKNS